MSGLRLWLAALLPFRQRPDLSKSPQCRFESDGVHIDSKMDDPGSLSQPLIGTRQSSYDVSLEDLKQLFNLSNIQEGTSYKSLGKQGGTEGFMSKLQTSSTEGIDPNSVADRIKA